jgi:hypothetical protein
MTNGPRGLFGRIGQELAYRDGAGEEHLGYRARMQDGLLGVPAHIIRVTAGALLHQPAPGATRARPASLHQPHGQSSEAEADRVADEELHFDPLTQAASEEAAASVLPLLRLVYERRILADTHADNSRESRVKGYPVGGAGKAQHRDRPAATRVVGGRGRDRSGDATGGTASNPELGERCFETERPLRDSRTTNYKERTTAFSLHARGEIG